MTAAQLVELTERMNERLDEWEMPPTVSFVKLTRGHVRSMIDVYETFLDELQGVFYGASDAEIDEAESSPLKIDAGDGIAVDSRFPLRGVHFDPESERVYEVPPWAGVGTVADGTEERSVEAMATVKRLYCRCGGEMLPTGIQLTSHPPKNMHRCQDCGMEVYSMLGYPIVTFQKKDLGAAQAVPVTDVEEGDPPPKKSDEKSTASDAPQKNAQKYSEPPPKSDEKLTSVESTAEPTAPAVPRLRTQEVKPLPDPDVARDKLAHALASGSNGGLSSASISRPRTLDEGDREKAARAAEIDAVVASLQAMAVNGEMPTVARWEAERVGNLPSWKTLARVHGLAWVDLARKAGLRYARQGSLEDEVKAAREKAAEKGHERLVSYEMLVAEIKRIAMGNAMPTQAQFDQSKPATWPTANALMARLETSWADLAEVLGLDYQRGRGRRRSAT